MAQLINIAVPVEKIAELISKGQICAADFSCLDAKSKQQVWQLCLWSCQDKVTCNKFCQNESCSHFDKADEERRNSALILK